MCCHNCFCSLSLTLALVLFVYMVNTRYVCVYMCLLFVCHRHITIWMSRRGKNSSLEWQQIERNDAPPPVLFSYSVYVYIRAYSPLFLYFYVFIRTHVVCSTEIYCGEEKIHIFVHTGLRRRFTFSANSLFSLVFMCVAKAIESFDSRARLMENIHEQIIVQNVRRTPKQSHTSFWFSFLLSLFL